MTRRFSCQLALDLPPSRGAELLRQFQLAVDDARDACSMSMGPIAIDVERDVFADDPDWIVGERCVIVGSAHLEKSEGLRTILRAFEARGVGAFADLAGAFAVIIWSPLTGEIVAARDPIGLRTLYYASTADRLTLSSHAAPLGGSEFDRQFIGEFLVNGQATAERSIYAGVFAVAPGMCCIWRYGTELHKQRFWNAAAIVPQRSVDPEVAAGTVRSLLSRAIAWSLRDERCAWSHLSGGLDSSSIVCLTQHLAQSGALPNGLAGTLTIVDHLGRGDESDFVNDVVRKYGVKNEVIADAEPWDEDGEAPPKTDLPSRVYPFYGRDRRMCRLVRQAGARVLLSGTGADHYLATSMPPLADLIVSGHVWRSFRDAFQWASAERRSAWRYWYRNGLFALMPRSRRIQRNSRMDRIPSWVSRRFAAQIGLSDQLLAIRRTDGPLGRKGRHAVAAVLSDVTGDLCRDYYEDGLDVRYPFLFKPLVEYCLGLPFDLRERPLQPKWILRSAMQGILPESIRLRTGKGGIGSRIRATIWRRRDVFQAIARDSILASLGIIKPAVLRRAIDRVNEGHRVSIVHLTTTLSLESWLRVTTNTLAA